MTQIRNAGVDFAQGWHIGRPQPDIESISTTILCEVVKM